MSQPCFRSIRWWTTSRRSIRGCPCPCTTWGSMWRPRCSSSCSSSTSYRWGSLLSQLCLSLAFSLFFNWNLALVWLIFAFAGFFKQQLKKELEIIYHLDHIFVCLFSNEDLFLAFTIWGGQTAYSCVCVPTHNLYFGTAVPFSHPSRQRCAVLCCQIASHCGDMTCQSAKGRGHAWDAH